MKLDCGLRLPSRFIGLRIHPNINRRIHNIQPTTNFVLVCRWYPRCTRYHRKTKRAKSFGSVFGAPSIIRNYSLQQHRYIGWKISFVQVFFTTEMAFGQECWVCDRRYILPAFIKYWKGIHQKPKFFKRATNHVIIKRDQTIVSIHTEIFSQLM